MNKKNAFIGPTISQKYGVRSGKKRYKCFVCGKFFSGGEYIDSNQIWKEYTTGKQTYQQLAQKYKCSVRTIQRKIDFST